jgi:hypothetical protein
MKRNTIGWQICCQWKDGSTSWENLSALKESVTQSRPLNML